MTDVSDSEPLFPYNRDRMLAGSPQLTEPDDQLLSAGATKKHFFIAQLLVVSNGV
jgi:hypothetical protein